MNFRFAHIADCHIGAWVDPRMKELPMLSFERAVKTCIERKVDFVLISGDLFNTAIPGIDLITRAVKGLKQLARKDIRCYAIAGSHDFSPSGKTILRLLEETGLLNIPTKHELDEEGKIKLDYIEDKSGAKITGIVGRRNLLDRSYYEMLDKKSLEKEEGFKIFMFHTAITELKEKRFEKMESLPLSLLPKNQNYYAGGHVHSVQNIEKEGFGRIVFPGPLFPANFKELEELKTGSFFINNVEDGTIKTEKIQIMPKNVYCINEEGEGKTPEEITEAILDDINDKEFNETIVTIRLSGKMKSGRISDINFKKIFGVLYDKSAYFVMRNTSKLESKRISQIRKESNKPAQEIEDEIIKDSIKEDGVLSRKQQIEMVKSLIGIFSQDKTEGETQKDFEKRIVNEAERTMDIEESDKIIKNSND